MYYQTGLVGVVHEHLPLAEGAWGHHEAGWKACRWYLQRRCLSQLKTQGTRAFRTEGTLVTFLNTSRVKSHLWGPSGVAQPSAAQWVCQVFEPWADRQGSWQTAHQWGCSFYPSAASQSGCEAPCRHSQKSIPQNFLPTVYFCSQWNYKIIN